MKIYFDKKLTGKFGIGWNSSIDFGMGNSVNMGVGIGQRFSIISSHYDMKDIVKKKKSKIAQNCFFNALKKKSLASESEIFLFWPKTNHFS